MTLRSLLPMTLLIVLCWPWHNGFSAEVRLKAQPQVSGDVLTLADVAEIADPDPEVVAWLGKITLGPAPLSGRTLRVDHNLVRSRLMAFGVNLAETSLVGQSFTMVGSATERPTTNAAKPMMETAPVHDPLQAIQTVVQQAFELRFRNRQVDDVGYELTVRPYEQDMAAFAGLRPDQIEFSEAALSLGGPQSLTLVLNRGPMEAPRPVRVAAWVQSKPRVLALRTALPKGSVIQAQDLQWKPATPNVLGVNVLAQAVGREVTRAMRAGDVLQPSDLSSVALVRQNDIVTVRVSSPGVTVRRQFKAVQAGGLDDTITLIALDDARERIQARVTGFHEAEIVGTTALPGSSLMRAQGLVQFVSGEAGEGTR